MPTLRFRAHEWLAEHFRFVQFPRQQLLPRQAPPPFFRHAMPWYLRFGLVVFGAVAIGGATVVLALLAVLIWATFAT